MIGSVEIAKGDNELEPRLIFGYDDAKNITTVFKDPVMPNPSGDTFDSYIFGYDDRYLVIKIQGIKYDSLDQTRISNIKSLTGQAITQTSTDSLHNALRDFRLAYPKQLVTTYTYDPVYGMTSQTNPDGTIKYYEYDELGRLSIVRNQDGKILSENHYHYKTLTP